jgi:hypothetical protein
MLLCATATPSVRRLGVHVRRVNGWEWSIDGSEPGLLLVSIDRLGAAAGFRIAHDRLGQPNGTTDAPRVSESA